ncbi:MAG: restriction endonuclease subunit S, partial [Desulfurococcales archaeon]|nr:restriction endonuclease subunit S [Desulfurococcales archaeon]
PRNREASSGGQSQGTTIHSAGNPGQQAGVTIMPHRTLDEYLKQTTPIITKQHATKPKYRLTGFYKETRFQETPIGKISKEWKIVKLYEISDKIKAGGTPRVSKKEYWNGNIPFVKIEDLTASGKYLYSTKTFITELGLEKSNAWIVPEESLLLAMYGSMGEVAINKIKVATNQAILGIIPRRGVTHVEYLYYWVLYFKPRWRIYAKWTTQPNLTAEIVKNSYVPLPPLEEQWGVAEVLSSVDEAIEATERLIEKLERLKRGLMQELLTKGIGHREYKQTSIGKIPKQWKIVRLGEVADLFQYGLSVKMYDTGKYPIVKMDSIINGEVKPINIKYVNINEKTFRKYKLEKGDILINRTNSYELVGRTGIFLLNGDYVFASYLIRIRPKKHLVNPRFLTYYLIFSNDRLRQIAARAVSQANINATNLKKFKMALPPLKEQEIITNVLLSYDEWIKLEEKRKEKLERLKRGLMDLLLTGRVRVRIEKLGESEDGSNPGRGG